MFVICALAIVLLFFLRPPVIQHYHHVMEIDQLIQNTAINPSDRTDSLVIRTQQQAIEKMSLKEVCFSLWTLATDKRFRYFAPQLFWTGISIAFFSGNLVELMAETIDGDQ
jgi:hypothetical protein